MADLSMVSAGKLRLVGMPGEQLTLVASVNIAAGQAVRIVQSSTGAGKWALADASDYEGANAYGIATETVLAGFPLTAVRKGVVDGLDLSGLDYWADVYLSDTAGALADARGTVGKRVGAVIPGLSVPNGTAYDKVLLVDFPLREEAYVSANVGTGTEAQRLDAIEACLIERGMLASASY